MKLVASTQKHLPEHIAIVMDGNGRWAKKRFLPRVAGHRAGVESARKVVRRCAELGIKVLTLFAFSSENWRRPAAEVGYLMDLFLSGLDREVKMMHANNIQLRFIGNRTHFSNKLIAKIKEVEQLTVNNTGLVLIIAADYGGQWDICQAVKKISEAIQTGQCNVADITPAYFASQLSFGDLPDPDLFIRTSGELRLSNFMLWQIAYTELYFTDTLWPDFNEAELEKSLIHFAGRERRFGKRSDQLSGLQHA